MDLPEKVYKLHVMHDHGIPLRQFRRPEALPLISTRAAFTTNPDHVFLHQRAPTPQEERLHETACEARWCDWAIRVTVCHSAVCVGVWKPRGRMNKA